MFVCAFDERRNDTVKEHLTGQVKGAGIAASYRMRIHAS